MRSESVTLPFAPLRLGRRTDTGRWVECSDGELVRHLAVFGTTGSGKTSLVLAMMLQLMDRARGFIFCTTKHDPLMPRALAWAAHQRQQLWRLRVFDPSHPVHNYNPTATRNPVTLAKLYHSQLPRIEPGSEAKHYHDLAMEFLLVACKAILGTGLQHVPDDLNQLASNYDLAAPVLRRSLRAVGKQDLMANVDAFFRRFFRRDEFLLREAKEALSGLTAVLTALEHGRGAAFLNQPYSDVDLLEACRRGAWVYLGLPRALDADGGALGRLFLTDLMSTLDAIQGDEGALVHAPFVIFLDEFPSYALPEFAAVFEQARSTGVGLVMGAQTVSGLSDRTSGLSEGFRDRVLGNCGHIVSFRVGPGESADYLSTYVGKGDRGFLQVSHTASRGRTWSPLSLSSWFGWTNRTDQQASFAGYRISKDVITESRVLTHDLAARGEAIWLSTKDEAREPFRFHTLWARTDTAPAGWDYQTLCASWDRQLPEPLGLGRAVRIENLRRSMAGSVAVPGGPGATPAPAGRSGSAPSVPANAAPGAAPAVPVGGRRRRRLEPGSFVFAPPGTASTAAPPAKTARRPSGTPVTPTAGQTPRSSDDVNGTAAVSDDAQAEP